MDRYLRFHPYALAIIYFKNELIHPRSYDSLSVPLTNNEKPISTLKESIRILLLYAPNKNTTNGIEDTVLK